MFSSLCDSLSTDIESPVSLCLTRCLQAYPYSKKSAWNAEDVGSIPGLERPWRREWLPTPVFFPGESHGLRRLTGYTPWSCKESDMTELLTQHWEVIPLVDAFFIFLCAECKLHVLLSHYLFTPPPKDIFNYLYDIYWAFPVTQ